MDGPLFLVENLFSKITFPLHLLTASEQSLDPTGANDHAVGNVGRAQRSAFNYWTGVTANQAQWVQVQCDRVRAANCIVIDRGHNLGGYPIFLRASNDGVTWQNVLGNVAGTVGLTIPAFSQPNNIGDTTYGVTTLEGAWACYFPGLATGAAYWQLYIPAMGAGLIPAIVGLYLGMAYVPYNLGFENPWSEDMDRLVGVQTVSPYGWMGLGVRNQVKEGTIRQRLQSADEYDIARYHIADLFGAGRPMWVCYDQAQADRMILVRRPLDVQGYAIQPRWFPHQVEIKYLEHEAAFPV